MSGRRLWRNDTWTVFDGNPEAFVGNFMVYPLRHVATREDLTDHEYDQLEEIDQALRELTKVLHSEILDELGLPQVVLDSFRIFDVENGHVGRFLEPQIYWQRGFLSLADYLDAEVARTYSSNVQEVRSMFLPRISGALERRDWRNF